MKVIDDNLEGPQVLDRELEALARRYYATVDEVDPDEVVALFTPDATYRRPGFRPIRGRAELLRFYRDQRLIKNGVHSVECVTGSGVLVAVQGRFVGELKDGAVVNIRFADFFRCAGQAIRERDTYFDAPLV